MTYGITSNGFNLKRQPIIQAEMEQDFRDTFGDVDTSPESVIGQLIGIFSKPHTDVWEQMENVYLQQSPVNAEGLNLDYLLALNGLRRLASLSTIVYVGLAGTPGAIIPQDTIVSSTTEGDTFTQNVDVTITDQNQILLYVRVDQAVDGATYTININATPYTIAAPPATTVEIIAGLLTDEINADLGADVIATLSGDSVKLETKSASFNTTLTGDMTYFTPAIYQSTEKGEILAITNTLTIIDTPTTGLDEVRNFEEGVKGRGVEEDPEARIRREQSLQILGAGTLPAMVARVQRDITGVTTVRGFENREDYTVDGREPHSFELVIVGGDNQEIADLIWEIKPAGIQTIGNVNGGAGIEIIDGNSDSQFMHFSRPIDQYAHIQAILSIYDEETFPIDGIIQVEQAILDYGNEFTIGLDILPQRFLVPIFTVPGIESAVVSVDATPAPGDAPVYQTTPFEIDETEIAVFAASRITVTIAP